jgi:hypothetical protein
LLGETGTQKKALTGSPRLIRWIGATIVVGGLVLALVLLVQSFLGPVFGYRCDTPARTIEDMRSTDDLRTRFNEDARSPRLILLLSPR